MLGKGTPLNWQTANVSPDAVRECSSMQVKYRWVQEEQEEREGEDRFQWIVTNVAIYSRQSTSQSVITLHGGSGAQLRQSHDGTAPASSSRPLQLSEP